MVGLALPAEAEFDINKQVEGLNKQIGEGLDGLGDFVSQFGNNMGEGVLTIAPKTPKVDNITTGSTRNVVAVSEEYGPGSIVVRTSTRKLYYVLSPGRALEYGVGVGRQGFQWGGVSYISRKKEWPSWRPPAEMIERERVQNNREIPEFMPGGPENPLGARALYLGSTLYRIHGTNQAQTIGGAVSSGCIRMRNKDVIDLYERVAIGSKVYVYH
ncbi:MAG: L,D-transpeptidase [Hyphomicrobiales bacterium]